MEGSRRLLTRPRSSRRGRISGTTRGCRSTSRSYSEEEPRSLRSARRRWGHGARCSLAPFGKVIAITGSWGLGPQQLQSYRLRLTDFQANVVPGIPAGSSPSGSISALTTRPRHGADRPRRRRDCEGARDAALARSSCPACVVSHRNTGSEPARSRRDLLPDSDRVRVRRRRCRPYVASTGTTPPRRILRTAVDLTGAGPLPETAARCLAARGLLLVLGPTRASSCRRTPRSAV